MEEFTMKKFRAHYTSATKQKADDAALSEVEVLKNELGELVIELQVQEPEPLIIKDFDLEQLYEI